MNITLSIIVGMLILSIAAPFISLYAVSQIKKKNLDVHVKIQKRLFWTCIVALIILEVQIRVSGGSGSLVSNSKYTGTLFFNSLLIAHIIGAVITYIFWGITVFSANKNLKKKKTLPGKYSTVHKKLGYGTIIGLFYTAITAAIVCTMAFFL